MADTFLLGIILQKRLLSKSIESLLDGIAQPEGYPEDVRLPVHTVNADKAEMLDMVAGVSKGGDAAGVLSLTIGERPNDYAYSSGLGYPFVMLSLFPHDQRLVKPKEVFFRLYFPYAGSKMVPSSSNAPARFVAHRVLEVLAPSYAFSTVESALDDADTELENPWRSYATTMVFGPELTDRLALNSEVLTRGLYYRRQLLGPLTWLADPTGLGNEWPAKLMVNIGQGDTSSLNIIDQSLDQFYRETGKRHREAVDSLLKRL